MIAIDAPREPIAVQETREYSFSQGRITVRRVDEDTITTTIGYDKSSGSDGHKRVAGYINNVLYQEGYSKFYLVTYILGLLFGYKIHGSILITTQTRSAEECRGIYLEMTDGTPDSAEFNSHVFRASDSTLYYD
jgi:hypothetical protein